MASKTKFFKLTFPAEGLREEMSRVTKAILVEGDEVNHNTEIIEQAITHNVIAEADAEEFYEGKAKIEEITEEQYFAGLKEELKNN